jgi:hypothetical protein
MAGAKSNSSSVRVFRTAKRVKVGRQEGDREVDIPTILHLGQPSPMACGNAGTPNRRRKE